MTIALVIANRLPTRFPVSGYEYWDDQPVGVLGSLWRDYQRQMEDCVMWH